MGHMKKVQILLSDDEFETLKDLSSRTGKKMGTLIREAVERVYFAAGNNERVMKAVDRLLSLPEAPVPDDYNAWEEEYSRSKGMGK
jgi:predicted DNA-binding protein